MVTGDNTTYTLDGNGTDFGIQHVMRNLLVNKMTAEVAAAFAADEIETIVLKGPALATWLYPGEVRSYSDSDLMVAPDQRAHAVRVLDRLGFAEYRSWMPDPLSLDQGGTAFTRNGFIVDLHCVLPGLDGDPSAIWASLLSKTERQFIGGAQLRVFDRHNLLLHVALHAAHHATHAESKPRHDLYRAIHCATEQEWRCAWERAQIYNGVTAFVAGLQLLPEGRLLAQQLGVSSARSFRYALRCEDNVIAEEMSALLSSDASVMKKLTTVLSEIFPHPEYMRWRSKLARRGVIGLATAYAWRPIWTLLQVPSALHALCRAWRSG
jgi:Uncharacterised nucleotidyltransferase